MLKLPYRPYTLVALSNAYINYSFFNFSFCSTFFLLFLSSTFDRNDPRTRQLSTSSECMVLGCLASWAVNILFQWDPLSFYLVHILIWFLSDWIMLSVVQVRTRILPRKFNLKYAHFFFRTDRFHSTNSILLLAGSFVSSLDLIYFYVHYSIRQFDGARGRSNFIGAAWPTSWSRESSHSNKNHSSSQKLLDLKGFIQSVNFFSCFCLITLMSFWNMKKNVYVVVRMNSSNL